MNISNDICGLFELDTSGKVMYSKVVSDGLSGNPPKNLVGQNFFEDVAPFNNIDEFRRRFRYFAQSSDSAQKFNFICQFDENPLEVKVMLAHICEREYDASAKLIIVDIRKA